MVVGWCRAVWHQYSALVTLCVGVVPGDPLQEQVDAFFWVLCGGWLDDAIQKQPEEPRAAVQPRTWDDISWPQDREGERTFYTTADNTGKPFLFQWCHRRHEMKQWKYKIEARKLCRLSRFVTPKISFWGWDSMARAWWQLKRQRGSPFPLIHHQWEEPRASGAVLRLLPRDSTPDKWQKMERWIILFFVGGLCSFYRPGAEC